MKKKKRKKKSLRSRISLSFVAVILVLGFVATFAGTHFIGTGIIQQAQNKVRLDLNTAREVYHNKLESIQTILEFTAIRPSIKKALLEKNRKFLQIKLEEVRSEGGLDMLAITDPSGKVVLRSQNPKVYGDDVSTNPLVQRILGNKKALGATEILPAQELEKEGAKLAAWVSMKIISAPKVKTSFREVERDGMALMAGAPIFDSEEEFIGVIYGGQLLNRNYEIVDKIKNIVYKNEKYEGKEIGTTTIFLGDLRISTNAKNENGERAIGTPVSKVVREQVLEKGRSWIDEAFVVNHWYITAYEPIRNLQGKIIGILGLGMLKKPFDHARMKIIAVFLGIVLFGVIIAFLVANFLAGRIFRPLKEMQKTAQQIAGGDYSQNIEVKSEDEVGELADSFNKMTTQLLQIQKELKNWAETLEIKVEERTAKIKEIQRQLIQAEKMASVGKLAAGVAHEINNPLTGILTNSSLLLEQLIPSDKEYQDMQVIVEETIRCREIVKGLLDFSRQSQPQKVSTDLNALVESVISLVRNQELFRNLHIQKDLDPSLPKIMVDPSQMRQVFMNILLNSAEAMPKGGNLKIESSFDRVSRTLRINFTDDGCGIEKEFLDKIFDPFFSTKEKGTGLGLAISYGIVESHGGVIEVKSKIEHGSTFSLKLPAA